MNIPRHLAASFLLFGLAAGMYASLAPLIVKSTSNGAIDQSILLLMTNLFSVLGIYTAKKLSGVSLQTLQEFGVWLIVLVFLGFMLPVTDILLSYVLAGILGVGCGILEVGANAETAELERRCGQSFLPLLHSYFSLGTLLGGVLISVSLTANLSLTISIAPTVVVGVAAAILIWNQTSSFKFTQPNVAKIKESPAVKIGFFPIFALALAAFVIILAEVSIMQWSGLWLSSMELAPEGAIGHGVVIFSLTTFLVRRQVKFRSDTLLFARNILIFFGLFTALLLAALAYVKNYYAALLLIALLGLSTGLIIPICLRIASQLEGNTRHAVSFVSLAGYSALILSPLLSGVTTLSFEVPIIFPVTITLIFFASICLMLLKTGGNRNVIDK